MKRPTADDVLELIIEIAFAAWIFFLVKPIFLR